MKSIRFSIFLSVAAAVQANAAQFETPFRATAAGTVVHVAEPGYACPTIHDLDGDGKKDLIVGQFKEGKMKFYKNIGTKGKPAYAKGVWLSSGAGPAVIPGIW
jgi:hypothetical protein